MRGHRGVDVEQQEHSPCERVAVVRREADCLLVDATPTVELNGERYVDDHCQKVGHGERHEDTVSGARRHVGSSEHDHVERVSDDTDGADDQTDVAVVRRVPDRVPAQRRLTQVDQRRGRRPAVVPRRRSRSRSRTAVVGRRRRRRRPHHPAVQCDDVIVSCARGAMTRAAHNSMTSLQLRSTSQGVTSDVMPSAVRLCSTTQVKVSNDRRGDLLLLLLLLLLLRKLRCVHQAVLAAIDTDANCSRLQ